MTRESYLGLFKPQNRNLPARLWDRYQFEALSRLPPPDEVIELGARLIHGYAQEAGEEEDSYQFVTNQSRREELLMNDYREIARKVISAHRADEMSCDHLSIEGASHIDFIGFYIDQTP